MKKILIALSVFFLPLFIMAQSPILQNVKIEYEKKVNTWASLSGFAEQMKDRIPQYSSTFYSYETDGDKSVYKAIPSNNNQRNFFSMQSGGTDDVIYSDLKNGEQVLTKSIFEKTYLINDSIRHYDWKITNEFRDIAGFTCRRATTIIMDSVFVVAFYTDEIVADGGPESFTGLPGTILGLVINRLHTTWYATKVSVTDLDPSKIKPPVDNKAQKVTREELIKTVRERFQSGAGGRFGSLGDGMIWSLMI